MKLVHHNFTNAKILSKKTTVFKTMWHKMLSNNGCSVPIFVSWRFS
jgi:hypothetical protein